MPFGLPDRTANTTIELETTPLLEPSSHVSATRPLSTSRVTSLLTEKCT